MASQVGLQVGDQLLDVCGLNLRACGKERAALVLHQVGNTITMKVQYNPLDYQSIGSLDDDDDDDEEESSEEDIGCGQVRSLRSSIKKAPRPEGSPTPRNSPKGARQLLDEFLPLSSAHSTLTRHQINQAVNQLEDGTVEQRSRSPGFEPRIVMPVMKKPGDLGVRLVGGNRFGIFIHSVEIDSAAYQVGLRSADQILEYNRVDLRKATAEQAAYELAKPVEKVMILVQYNPESYNLIKDQPGDSFFVRAMFTRFPDCSNPHQLTFSKDDILYVDNTMYKNVHGHWSAWIVDSDGNRGQWGIIPSKFKVEEEMLMKGGSAAPGKFFKKNY